MIYNFDLLICRLPDIVQKFFVLFTELWIPPFKLDMSQSSIFNAFFCDTLHLSSKNMFKIGTTSWYWTLINVGEGGEQSSSSVKNCNFSTTKHLVDLRPVCKLEFVRGGQVKKNRALYLSVLVVACQKFENSCFQRVNLRFLTIFADLRQKILRPPPVIAATESDMP